LLIPLLQELFSTRNSDDWINLLVEARIPVGPINDIPTILADPQVAAREMVQELEHATAGPIQVLGPVAKLSRTPAALRTAPPVLGADTETILSERLDYSPEAIEALRQKGIV
jgi:crotonobetainyl-CoA:carnitine CoA-transferase CaiB-like acyl-CoA transferase